METRWGILSYDRSNIYVYETTVLFGNFALKSYVFAFRDHWERLENPAYKDSWYVLNGSGVYNEAKGILFLIEISEQLWSSYGISRLLHCDKTRRKFENTREMSKTHRGHVTKKQ